LKTKRVILNGGDDEEEVYAKYKQRRQNGEHDVMFARVITMIDPPITKHKFIVFRFVEDKN